MKTKFIFILSVLLLSGLNAQEFKYFNVDNATTDRSITTTTFLKPKDLQMRLINGITPQSHYGFTLTEEYMKSTYAIYKEVFGEVDKKTEQALRIATSVNFMFDENLKIYYFNCSFLTRDSLVIAAIEDKLYEFGQKFRQFDLSPFIRFDDREIPQGGIFTVRFANFILYEKNPERIRYERYYY